jgi:hypothetical protein
MPNIAPAYTLVNPSYMMPEVLLPYSQASGFAETLATGQPLVRLGNEDLVAYIRRADIRTKIAAGMSAYNELPSVEVVMSMVSTPSYLFRVRAEYDHHDTAAMGNWGVPIVAAQRLGMRQSHFQMLRTACLFGMNPANGEGLINADGVTTVPIPADSNSNDTVVTYDNGEMGLFLSQQVQAIKTATMQLGMGRKFVFLGPQRTLGQFEYNVVQLTQFQRPGAGTASTAGLVKDVLETNHDEILWCYDDTLKGAGDNGTDIILIVMPEVDVAEDSPINTNEFAKLQPGLDACTLQLCDMLAPREIPTPIPGGAIDILSELRATSGWPVRPEAVRVLEIAYQ